MDLKTKLASVLPAERILTRPLERYAYANDASYFLLIPQAVVQAASIDEIRGLFQFSQQNRIPLTFRAAGTSLSGQSVSNGILVVLAHHWGNVQVEDGGGRVRAQPGVVGGFINNVLKPYGRRIGPDPASIDSAMLGGILVSQFIRKEKLDWQIQNAVHDSVIVNVPIPELRDAMYKIEELISEEVKSFFERTWGINMIITPEVEGKCGLEWGSLMEWHGAESDLQELVAKCKEQDAEKWQ